MSDARVTQKRSAFSISCRVEIDIRASAKRVWGLLTDATGFPRWNSTVTRIDGEIRDGARLVVHVPGTERTFNPTISGFVRDGGDVLWTDVAAGRAINARLQADLRAVRGGPQARGGTRGLTRDAHDEHPITRRYWNECLRNSCSTGVGTKRCYLAPLRIDGLRIA